MSKQYPGGFITKNFTAPTASAAPGVWTLDQAMYYIKQSLWPLPPQPDPYFPYVTALLHGNGNAAGTTLFNQDLSGNNLPLTINNDLSANTKTPFTPPAGTSTYGSGYFPGSNGYLYTPSNTAFGFGTGDFTLEAWVWLGAQVNTYPNWIQLGTANNNASLPLGAGWGDSGMGYVLMIKVGTDRTISGYNQSSFVGVWSHIAVVRSSGVVKTYINGTVVDTWANTADVGSTNFLRSGCGINEYGNFPWNGYISNLRVTNTAVYTNNFTPSTSPLTAVSGTKLLTMQTNFTGNNNLFYDSSSNNFPVTRNGNTTQGTFTPYGANWSNYFDGSGDYLSTPGNAAFDFGSGNFTVEAWLYRTTTGAFTVIGDVQYWYAFALRVNSSGAVFSYGFSSATSSQIWYCISANNIVPVDAWCHLALVRNGSNIIIYANGVNVASTTPTGSAGTTSSIRIAHNDAGVEGTGYVSNARIVKGTAVYTANFTPSTTPLTVITGTSLLTCADNRFIDDSTNNFPITRNGDVSVQRFSPFSPTAAYSTSVIGGSGYFDGSGDYLQSPSNSSVSAWSTDFTIEGWYYLTVINAGSNALWTNSTSNSDGMTYAYVTSSGAVALGRVGVNETASASGVITTNRWIHIAFVRNGGSVNIYVNGTSVATPSTGNLETTTTKPITIGGEFQSGGGDFNFTGYIADFRVVKGTAVYTSAFTPPTAPLTAITNTSLLLSYTNAGILDNAMMMDWETIGDATVSLTTYKYGTGSMQFDGTADRLTAPSSPNMAFGTGDFTIEGWFYINSGSGTNNGALQISGTTGGLQANQTNNIAIFSANSSGNKWGVYYANTFSYGSASTTQTWTYIALVRSSGSLKLYINGTADATFGTKTDTTNYTGQNICVGGYYSTSYLWNGYIDDLRITKGVARYTANFTPPTSQLQDQ